MKLPFLCPNIPRSSIVKTLSAQSHASFSYVRYKSTTSAIKGGVIRSHLTKERDLIRPHLKKEPFRIRPYRVGTAARIIAERPSPDGNFRFERARPPRERHSARNRNPPVQQLHERREQARFSADYSQPILDADPSSEGLQGPKPPARKWLPVSIPYTTAESEFLYGHSVVVAALKAKRRKFYKLYIHPRSHRPSSDYNIINDLERLAKTARVHVQPVGDTWLAVMDKMSNKRPHNVSRTMVLFCLCLKSRLGSESS